ncbi:allantoicase [Blastomyces gilchristii SLH14081]|uniref:allantoicase n=1 Tax=Blastomyces gilchristii (strain SLH14081) TaxID=559298 RepID=A0A179UI33_BLAGS|nr:allantoicase [Blastomyces gilchristii SLH14081]EQL33732.1 allantoicase [Blastomyces dermatitidis ATCC 26199]OAT06797.1 allantoicase [Blastomyces gilchristii SLH14081]
METHKDKTITPLTTAADIDKTFSSTTTNLASSSLNATILACSDEYFAAASNLLTPTPPIHRPGVFVHTGAWYDGWETRRHNPEEFDWAVIKLGVGSGVVVGVEIDTAHFYGNYGESVLVEGTHIDKRDGAEAGDAEVVKPTFNGWTTILPKQPCGPSRRQGWLLSRPSDPITHVRVRMYPDGGFARVRLYGHAVPGPAPAPKAIVASAEGSATTELEELSSALMGGLVVSASNQHFTPASNTLLPGRGEHMGDGWETARSRTPGHVDWAVVKLGLVGTIEKVVVDTKDFRGNFPRAVRVHGFLKKDVKEGQDPKFDDEGWVEVVRGDQPCKADLEHVFEGGLLGSEVGGKAFSHVMLTMVPDGGVKRFRVFGRRAV